MAEARLRMDWLHTARIEATLRNLWRSRGQRPTTLADVYPFDLPRRPGMTAAEYRATAPPPHKQEIRHAKPRK